MSVYIVTLGPYVVAAKRSMEVAQGVCRERGAIFYLAQMHRFDREGANGRWAHLYLAESTGQWNESGYFITETEMELS